MILFIKQDCSKCERVKKELSVLGLDYELMDIETYQGLAELAYYSLVPMAEKLLPILWENGKAFGGVIPIIKYLKTRKGSNK